MLFAIDGSGRSMDLSIAQALIDRACIDRLCCANYGWSSTIDHSWPSIDACTVRYVDD